MRNLRASSLPVLFVSSLLLIPAASLRAADAVIPPPAADKPVVNVRELGATGDGKTNDSVAFRKASAIIEKAGGGTLQIPKGTYIVGEQMQGLAPDHPNKGFRNQKYPFYKYTPSILIQGVSGLVIEGNGATLKMADGLRIGSFDKDTGATYTHPQSPFFDYAYQAAPGNIIEIHGSRNVVIRDLELDGNSGKMVLGGPWGDTGRQCMAFGIALYSNTGVRVENIHTHHHGLDGIMIAWAGMKETDAAAPHELRKVNSEYNARQGLSWVGGRGLTVSDSTFNHTGRGAFQSAPGAGLDIEAEESVCRDGLFRNCEFINNAGCGVVADCGDGGYTTFDQCTLWGTSSWALWNRKPGMTFKGCRIYGASVWSYGSATAPELATQYRDCHFEDKEHPEFGVYRNYTLIGMDGTAENVLFDNCDIVANKLKSLWLTGGAIIRNSRITHGYAEVKDGDFQANIQGDGRIENTRFLEAFPQGHANKNYILVQTGVGEKVVVDGPVVRWGSPVGGGVGMIPKNIVDLTVDGKPAATLVLPETTEWDTYVNADAEALEAYLKQHFPKATAEKLAKARAALPAARAAEAKRVGDEELLAAEEVIEFVKKMSGATLPLVRLKPGAALPEGNLILLGAALAKQQGFESQVGALPPDGFIATVKENKVILSGKRARGTLYAAYEWLESFGCRWLMPGPFGEVFREQKNLSTAIQTTMNPSHTQRYFWGSEGSTPAFPRWSLRNKGNYIRALGDPAVTQHHASEAPLQWGATQTARGIAGEKGEKVLPDEYYALEKGIPNRHIANMANPKVWELCAEYYSDYFYSNPLAGYASISMADGMVLDDRAECRKLDSNEFDWTVGAPVATDRIWFYHRRYLDTVKAEHPERKFGVLVYMNNTAPPRLETVHPNMALIFAPLSICPLHHVRDENCKTNRTYRKWFEGWMAQKRANGAEGYYYDYLPIGYQWSNFILSPQWHIIGQNYPWFHELGLDGHTTQGWDDWGATGLSAYVAQRLYWNIKQDYTALVREYCALRFGERAAETMFLYYRVFEERMKVAPDTCSNETYANHLAIDQPTRTRAKALLEIAGALIQEDRQRAQYQAAVDFQAAMDAWCDGIDHARATGDFAAAVRLMDPAFTIAAKLNALYPNFIASPRIDPKDTRTFTPAGWRNKYLAWDKKIKAARASVCLPRMMRVALDTDNTAWTKGWHKPEVPIADVEEWDCTMVPDIKFKTEREVAAFFYRTEVEAPAEFAGAKKVVLYFPSLIARALCIWVNGQPVQFDFGTYKDPIWRGNTYFWDEYNHQQAFAVTSLIKPGQVNTIAFRVFKSFDHGGTYDRVFLLADPAVEDSAPLKPQP